MSEQTKAATTEWRCIAADGSIVKHQASPTWGHDGHIQCAEVERGGAASEKGAGAREQGIWTPPRVARMAVDALVKMSADEGESDRNRMRARLAAQDMNRRLLGDENGRTGS